MCPSCYNTVCNLLVQVLLQVSYQNLIGLSTDTWSKTESVVLPGNTSTLEHYSSQQVTYAGVYFGRKAKRRSDTLLSTRERANRSTWTGKSLQIRKKRKEVLVLNGRLSKVERLSYGKRSKSSTEAQPRFQLSAAMFETMITTICFHVTLAWKHSQHAMAILLYDLYLFAGYAACCSPRASGSFLSFYALKQIPRSLNSRPCSRHWFSYQRQVDVRLLFFATKGASHDMVAIESDTCLGLAYQRTCTCP
jgi:hypothetical protein